MYDVQCTVRAAQGRCTVEVFVRQSVFVWCMVHVFFVSYPGWVYVIMHSLHIVVAQVVVFFSAQPFSHTTNDQRARMPEALE